MRICILTLIGLPAAGKTTFSHWLLKQTQLTFNVLHLNYDDFLNFSTEFRKELDYKLQRIEIMKILQSITNELSATQRVPHNLENKITRRTSDISKDYLIICDDNNFYRSMRYKLYQFCRNNRLAYAQIYFDCGLEQALLRNAQRSKENKVPDYIIEQMAKHIDKPNSHVFKWEMRTLQLNNAIIFENAVDEIVTFIATSFDFILKPFETAAIQFKTPVAPASIVHEVDLLLRRRIGELLNTLISTKVKQTKAHELNCKRKEILQELRESEENILTEMDLSKIVDYLQ